MAATANVRTQPAKLTAKPGSHPRAIALALLVSVTPHNPTFALRVGAVLCALLFLVRASSYKVHAADIAVVVYTTHAALSLTWATDPAITQNSVLNQVAVAAIFFAVRSVVVDERSAIIVAAGYLAGCLYAAILLVRQNAGSEFVSELSTVRFGIAGLNPNYLGYALCAGAPLVAMLWRLGKPRYRPALLVVLGVLAFGVLQSGCRGALLGLALFAAWVPFRRFVPTRGLALICLAFIVAAISIASGVADRWLLAADRGTIRATGDLAGRLQIWPIARRIFSENMMFGIGESGFQSHNAYYIGAHNLVLEIGTGLGVVGLALFAALLYKALIGGTRTASASMRNLLIGSVALALAPAYLSGHWELSPSAWSIIGLASTLPAWSPGSTESAESAGEEEERPHSGQDLVRPDRHGRLVRGAHT